MSGEGGKGGTQNNEVKLDPRIEQGAASAISGALRSAGLDMAPNRGVTAAAFTPQQQAAFQGADEAAAVFGLPTGGGPVMPAMETAANGIQGYSTGGLFDSNVDKSMTSEQQDERKGILDYFKDEGNKIAAMPAAAQRPQQGGK
jgi:hypothetical protein